MKQQRKPQVKKPNQRLRNNFSMTIRNLFYSIFICLVLLGFFLNYRYLDGMRVQNSTKPINEDDYWIKKIICMSAVERSSSVLEINYKGNSYDVGISGGFCKKIKNGEMKPKFYYYKEKDMIFYENQYMPFTYVYLTYIAAFLIPLFGFIVWRKELDNHYSTM